MAKRTDFDAIEDGSEITLHPRSDNPLHKRAVKATYAGGYFYCVGSRLTDGPDYYLGDVFRYCDGYTPA